MNDALHTLLEVQAHDTRLDQLRHQLASMPERAALEAARSAALATEAQIGEQSATLDGLARDQKRLDDEVATLGAKRKGFDDRLYGGTVSNPRELQDLQDEIAALSRRIDALEEQELELMEQIEPVEATLAELRTTAEGQAGAIEDGENKLTVAEAEIQAQLAAEQEARDGVAAGVPADLLAQYDKLRKGLGGVGVAKLVGSQCGGCHLTLSAVEVAKLRKLAADAVAHCDECGRILVP